MKITQRSFSESSGWKTTRNEILDPASCNLVLLFGKNDLLSDPGMFASVANEFPNASVVIHAAGSGTTNLDSQHDTMSLTAIQFLKTRIRTATTSMNAAKNSFDAAYYLSRAIDPVDLQHVLIIADGSAVNGSDFAYGLKEYLPKNTKISGGLTGSFSSQNKSWVGLNGIPAEGQVVAIGFYGSGITITHNHVAGWEVFGPQRFITKSKGNTLLELNHEPALDIYKMYLDQGNSDYQRSVLLYPFCIRNSENDIPVIRTIRSINENNRSITFAGSMPEGAIVQLMKTSTENLINSAQQAAQRSVMNAHASPELALMICSESRKQVLEHRADEEIQVIRKILGAHTAMTGFYSAGEFSFYDDSSKCELQNQTLTLTTFSEKE